MTIAIHFIGRLGNQLFQYATLRNISLKKNYDIYYDTNFEWHGQKCLLNFFNLEKSFLHFLQIKKSIKVLYITGFVKKSNLEVFFL